VANHSPVTLASERLAGGVRAAAPAKINRFLHIIGRRPDGYHLLETGFQFVDWCDWLHFRVAEHNDIRILNDPMRLGSDNLVFRAARAIHDCNLPGIDIWIDKQLPSGAGLGGGSSDAATTLAVLNTLWGRNLSHDQLMQIGATLGADVPVFIFGESCFASGIGEICERECWPGRQILLAYPRVHVATSSIFQHPKLTRDTPSCRIRASQLDTAGNDCETLVRALYPEVDRLMDALTAFGEPRLTGTGACVFVVDPDLSDHDALRCAETLATVKQTLLSNRSMLYTGRANA
jgi:4-diphosphocytidyl-2-C-methyl-D-erythritol kinase